MGHLFSDRSCLHVCSLTAFSHTLIQSVRFQAHYHASIAELIEQSGRSSPRGGRPSGVVAKEKLSWAAYHYAQAGVLLPGDEQLRTDCLRNALIYAVKVRLRALANPF